MKGAWGGREDSETPPLNPPHVYSQSQGFRASWSAELGGTERLSLSKGWGEEM